MTSISVRFRDCGFCLAVCAAGLLLTSLAWGQSTRPAVRIQSAIRNARRVTLAGSLRPQAQSRFDAGAMPAGTRLQGISMVFNLSDAQQADLNALLTAQQDPASPLYHRWLTPAQFGARFGMSSADLAKVETWLRQQGFTIDSVSPSRTRIRFSGTVAQAEAAFSAPMHYYEINGARHFAPAAALSLPAALAPTVLAIRHLDDFRPRPRILGSRAESGARIRTGSQGAGPKPRFTSSVSGNVYFAPGDIATAYDVRPLYAAGDDGSGQTIAVVGQSAILPADIENFQSAAGLTVKSPSLILVPGTGSSAVFAGGDEAESDLDVEWAGAIATGANVDFVYVGSDLNHGVFDALTYAVEQDLAPIVSTSYGSCEAAEGSGIAALESVLQQAAAQGQTVIAAAGDDGATDCAGFPGLTTAQQNALAVDYPASSAFVTGVGGTEITTANAASGNSYWQAQSSSDLVSSALQYIPEIAWNDDAAGGGLSAGGGGASAAFDKPSWQAGVPGIPADGKRDVPDLALYASPSVPGYLFCTSDQSQWQAGQEGSCDQGFRDAATSDLTVAGGTSFAVPIFAGMVAILNQEAGYTSGQGLVNPTLYSLAAKPATYAAAFHDVTSGSNACTAGTSGCGSSAGFSTGAGYDQVTGLGSVDLDQLALAWPQNTGPALIATTTSISASSSAPAVNTKVTFTVTVSAGTGDSVPTGTVALTLDGTVLTPLPLSANGTAVYTTSFASPGRHQLLARYSGDSVYAASTGVVSVNAPVVSSGTGSIALGATNLTLAAGGSGASTITVTPSGGYTGTVLLAIDTPDATALQNLCYQFTSSDNNGNGTVIVSGTSAVTTQLTLDANAADCSGDLRGGSGKHALRSLLPLRASGASSGPGSRTIALAFGLAGLLLVLAGVCAFAGRFRRRRAWAGAMAVAALGLALAGCGGGNSAINLGTGSSTTANPPAGTYTITVTGQDSVVPTIQSTTQFTFTIQ